MIRRICCSLLLATAPLPAQGPAHPVPVIGFRGVQHAATYQSLSSAPFSGAPAGIATGAIFVLQGHDLGPEELVAGQAPYGLRLPDEPGGTEVHVRSVGTGKVAQASILYSSKNIIAAILPRTFPLGDAEVRVWYQGQASEPVNAPIVYSFPGLFTLTQNGVGRAVIQNHQPDGSIVLNGLTHPARPGQFVTLWGTGLGDAREDEVRIYLGDEFHPAAFAGPAPGFPGLDQFNVRIPDDLPLKGCYVRLVVAGDGLGSGPASIAIGDGEACEHPWGLSPERLAKIEAGDPASRVYIYLSDVGSIARLIGPPVDPEGARASARLYTFDEPGLEVNSRPGLEFTEERTCTSWTLAYNPDSDLPVRPQQLDPEGADPWLLIGPDGRALPMPALVGAPVRGFVGSEPRESGFLAPGEWTVRIPDGWGVGPLDFTLLMPQPPDVDSPSVLRRGQDFELSWPADQIHAGDEVRTELYAWEPDPQTPDGFRGAAMRCVAADGASSIRIPLSELPAPVEGAAEAEIRLSVRSSGPLAPAAGVDRVEATASVHRSWTIPLD